MAALVAFMVVVKKRRVRSDTNGERWSEMTVLLKRTFIHKKSHSLFVENNNQMVIEQNKKPFLMGKCSAAGSV